MKKTKVMATENAKKTPAELIGAAEDYINELIVCRQKWEHGTLKASLDELYELLALCEEHRWGALANRSHRDDALHLCHQHVWVAEQGAVFLTSTRGRIHHDAQEARCLVLGVVGALGAHIPSTCRNRHMPHRH